MSVTTGVGRIGLVASLLDTARFSSDSVVLPVYSLDRRRDFAWQRRAIILLLYE